MKTKRLQKIVSQVLLLFFVFSLLPGNAFAENDDLQKQINRLIKIIEDQGKQIKAQQKSIEELKDQVASGASQNNPVSENTQPTQKTVADKQAPTPTTQKVTAKKPTTRTQPVGQAPKNGIKNIPDIATTFSQPGVLTPKGTLVIEPSLSYSNSSNERVALFGYTILPAITIGLIDIRRVNYDTFVGALAARYGLTDRLEAEIKIPYIYRSEETTTRPQNAPAASDQVFSLSDHDIGDVEFGLRYQLNQPTTGPYYIAGLRVKSNTGRGPFDIAFDMNSGLRQELPTGSGFWGIQPSITAILPIDPAVLYGSLSYMWHIEDSVNGPAGQGTYNPGDIIGFNFGMGFGLNEKTSLSFGYDHSVIGKSTLNGSTAQGVSTTHVGSLLIGGSYKLTEKTSLNLSVGLGVTENAPDVQITLRVPYSF